MHRSLWARVVFFASIANAAYLTSRRGDPSSIPEAGNLRHATTLAGSINHPGKDDAKEIVDVKRHKDDFKQAMGKVKNMSPKKMAEENRDLMSSTLFPGKKPDLGKKVLDLFLALICIVWLWVYKTLFYATYQHQERSYKHWSDQDDEKVLSGLSQEERNSQEAYYSAPEADFVIVCYNPARTASDDEQRVPRGLLKSTFGEGMLRKLEGGAPHQKKLPRLEKMYNFHEELGDETFVKTLSKKASGILNFAQGSSTENVEAQHAEDEKELLRSRRRDVREALVQDLYEWLPRKGFSLSMFTSMHSDYLFLCITLKSDAMVRRTAERFSLNLQLQLNVLDKLNISQPDDPISSPPYVTYDRSLATIIMPDKGDKGFYRTFDGPEQTTTILNSLERIHAISNSINKVLDLQTAKNKGLIVDYFPAHLRNSVFEFKETWYKWGLLTDLTFSLPITSIREYVGARTAFLFAWNGFYCKLLLALIPVVVIFELVNFLARHGYITNWNDQSLLGLSTVIAVWTRIAHNLWQRQERFLVTLWDLKAIPRDSSVRPQFSGTLMPSQLNGNLLVKTYPGWKVQLRAAVSWLVTIAFCAVDSVFVVGFLDAHHGRLSVAASVVLALIIQVFTLIYNVLGRALTDFENHELRVSYHSSYYYKLFMFQFVNQYSAFLYIAVKEQHTKRGCPTIHGHDNNCVGLVEQQLPWTFAALTITQVATVIFNRHFVSFLIWLEELQTRREGYETEAMTFLEEQSKYSTFRVHEEVEVSVTLALTLGYVLIFGSIAPRIAFLSVMVFAVHLRGTAKHIMTSAARTLPIRAAGIGILGDSVHFLASFAMAFSGYLLVSYGPFFKGTQVLTRVSGFLLWGLFVYMLWSFVDVCFMTSTPDVDNLDQRRDYVMEELLVQRSNALAENISELETQEGVSLEYPDEVADGRWAEIPRLVDKHKAVLEGESSSPRRTLTASAADDI
jgi:hypothetical protein